MKWGQIWGRGGVVRCPIRMLAQVGIFSSWETCCSEDTVWHNSVEVYG